MSANPIFSWITRPDGRHAYVCRRAPHASYFVVADVRHTLGGGLLEPGWVAYRYHCDQTFDPPVFATLDEAMVYVESVIALEQP